MTVAMIPPIITRLKMKLLIIAIIDMNAMCDAESAASLGQSFDTFFQLINANPPDVTLNPNAIAETTYIGSRVPP